MNVRACLDYPGAAAMHTATVEACWLGSRHTGWGSSPSSAPLGRCDCGRRRFTALRLNFLHCQVEGIPPAFWGLERIKWQSTKPLEHG